jgi:phosphatidylserine/phosphatidylglycerophosphate/cardiolipin synthase-like enzyme
MLNVALPAAAAVMLVIVAAFIMLLRRIISPQRAQSYDENWLCEFSVNRYRPMERLLSDDDFEFLEHQPGYKPRMKRKLRAERRAIYRDYLRSLAGDFQHLYGAVQMLMLTSDEDRPDLAAVLVRHKWAFTSGMVMIHFRLLLHALGKQPVDIGVLVGSLDALRVQFQQLSAAQACAAA